jgi:hypothetical protein
MISSINPVGKINRFRLAQDYNFKVGDFVAFEGTKYPSFRDGKVVLIPYSSSEYKMGKEYAGRIIKIFPGMRQATIKNPWKLIYTTDFDTDSSYQVNDYLYEEDGIITSLDPYSDCKPVGFVVWPPDFDDDEESPELVYFRYKNIEKNKKKKRKKVVNPSFDDIPF